ncbi:hypothetical protein pEaSNUABM46_00218 [Erwinia phage pEa_SNUABM_46]|nr:hypothetical protein pEaSNUABM45_00218 [Erwinia phage pEa_SNUABM_45]QYW04202.1 hypothetical protein pEaSNUABM46_00218 [Erwinia phage pEa_SNUABM_46]
MPRVKQPNVDRILRIAAKMEVVLRDQYDYAKFIKLKPDMSDLKFVSAVENLIGASTYRKKRHVVANLLEFFDKKKKYQEKYEALYAKMLEQAAAPRKLKTYDVFIVAYYLRSHLPSGHPLISITQKNYDNHFDIYFEAGPDHEHEEFLKWELARILDKPD